MKINRLEHVGIVVNDLDAAKALGLHTAYVHRPLENGPARVSKPAAPGKYDFQVKDFNELASALGL